RRQDLPHPGPAAGPAAQGGHARQGPALPRRDRSARRAGPGALDGSVVDAFRRAKDPHDKVALRDAVAATQLATVVGPVKWGGQGPFKNVPKTPLVLGQWVKGKKHRYELGIVNNHAAPEIPVGGKLQLIS